MKDTRAKPKRQDRPPWHLPEQAAAYVVATGVFTTMGPFGTYAMPLLWRLGYWAMALGAGWVFVSLSLIGLLRFGFVHSEAPVARVALAILVAALPTAVAVMAIETQMRPTGGPFWNFEILGYVALVCLVIGGTIYGFLRPRFRLPSDPDTTAPRPGAPATGARVPPTDNTPEASVAEPPAHAAFFKRLPPRLGGELISLSAQDHYVEVTTNKGRELIHMRLSDALHELRDYPGRRIHRSHWIAEGAFQGLSRENGKLVAHLSDGRRLNVSRSYSAAAREMIPATVKTLQ
ncbi:LytTR family DNA-binding domain-containing protein [Shimia sp.]|uniref:LytTR family DNA-binding domain-containing protein n=1 Tax=Shimia sp. TaxID=1954381 RepID=UPI0035670310